MKDNSSALRRSAVLPDIKGAAPFCRNGSGYFNIPVVAPQANFPSAAGTIRQHKIRTLPKNSMPLCLGGKVFSYPESTFL
jgi:hypothetical protein